MKQTLVKLFNWFKSFLKKEKEPIDEVQSKIVETFKERAFLNNENIGDVALTQKEKVAVLEYFCTYMVDKDKALSNREKMCLADSQQNGFPNVEHPISPFIETDAFYEKEINEIKKFRKLSQEIRLGSLSSEVLEYQKLLKLTLEELDYYIEKLKSIRNERTKQKSLNKLSSIHKEISSKFDEIFNKKNNGIDK